MIITTNIRLPQEQWKALKIMAIQAGTSVSALLRQAVAQILQTANTPTKRAKTKKNVAHQDPFFKVIGLGTGGPSDDSSEHDRYLYQRK